MPRYASKTSVPEDRSQTELKRVLTRYGASHFMAGQQPGLAIVAFQVEQRLVRLSVPIPELETFSRDARGAQRHPKSAMQSQAQAIRQRWRALVLVVKANLEAVDAQVATFEQAFMPYLVLPGGKTVAEKLLPELKAIYESGKAPQLLLTSAK